MRCTICLLVLGALVLSGDDDPWQPIERRLGDGLAAVEKRDAALAYAHVKKALDALEEQLRLDWAKLFTFEREGWTFFKPNVVVSATKRGGETMSNIVCSANGRRPADGVIVIFHATSSAAHVDFTRQKFADPKRRPAGTVVEKRKGWLVAKTTERMKTVATIMGEHTLISITLSRDDPELLGAMVDWLDFDHATRLDVATGRARAK